MREHILNTRITLFATLRRSLCNEVTWTGEVTVHEMGHELFATLRRSLADVGDWMH